LHLDCKSASINTTRHDTFLELLPSSDCGYAGYCSPPQNGQNYRSLQALSVTPFFGDLQQCDIHKQESPIRSPTRATSPTQRPSRRHREPAQDYGRTSSRHALPRRLCWSTIHGECEGAWRGECAGKRKTPRWLEGIVRPRRCPWRGEEAWNRNYTQLLLRTTTQIPLAVYSGHNTRCTRRESFDPPQLKCRDRLMSEAHSTARSFSQ